MKYCKYLFFPMAILTNSCFASIPTIFPNADNLKENCVVVTISCSFDPGQTCTKKYCGVQIKQAKLEEFVKNHQLIGRKFRSLFDLETYMKKNLPPDLSTMVISFSYKNKLQDYNPNRISIQLDSKDYISQILIQ